MPSNNSITTTNRTASSVTVIGSSFVISAVSTEILLNNVVIPGTGGLGGTNWSITLSTPNSGALTYVLVRYGEDALGDPIVLDSTTFLVSAYTSTFIDTISGKTMASFSSGVSPMKRRSATRKKFPKV